MSVRPTSRLTRHVIYTCNKVRYASTTTRHSNPDHGQHIYVYHQFQTNQIVYSLTRALKNNASLRQLPFNGKKTVPRALRKDLWSPLALISFPPGTEAVGLSAFQKLREYRRLHELSWDESLRTDEKGNTISRKERGRKICDQKANSVADIATVLGKIGTPEGEAIGLKGFEEEREAAAELPKVEVKWADLIDAHFAGTWPENVIHDKLEWEAHQKEQAKLARERRKNDPKRLLPLGKQVERRQLSEEEKNIKAERTALHLATKAEKHAKYLETRGISEAQYLLEVQELLKAKAERQNAKLAEQALSEEQRKKIRAERKQLAEQAKVEAELRLEKEKEQALPEEQREKIRAERKQLAEQAKVAELRLEKEKADKLAVYLVQKAEKHAKYLAKRGITENEYRLEREEQTRVKAEKRLAEQVTN